MYNNTDFFYAQIFSVVLFTYLKKSFIFIESKVCFSGMYLHTGDGYYTNETSKCSLRIRLYNDF